MSEVCRNEVQLFDAEALRRTLSHGHQNTTAACLGVQLRMKHSTGFRTNRAKRKENLHLLLALPTSPRKAISVFKQLGTLKHYKHFLLINEAGHSDSLCISCHFMSGLLAFFLFRAKRLQEETRLGDVKPNSLARMEGDWGSQPLPGSSFLNYFESAVLGVVITGYLLRSSFQDDNWIETGRFCKCRVTSLW